MQQYLELLKAIKEKGTYKPAAREGMPGTQSLFGYQFRHDLADGFPALTTKKLFWKGVVVELLWFLKGDTNIKYLVDNGVNIWNEDAYNYYCLYLKKKHHGMVEPMGLDKFIENVKNGSTSIAGDYQFKMGDCGFQYGKVWRSWPTGEMTTIGLATYTNADGSTGTYTERRNVVVDQIHSLIERLIKNPESRRHIVTAIDPAHDTDLALYWCHAMFQFNCRPLTFEQKLDWAKRQPNVEMENLAITEAAYSEACPKYYLDCHLYQRSADVVLGVPFNIASYALLTHILAEICNMIPGEFIHTFGDVHIYDNHVEAVETQLSRTPTSLPRLSMNTEFWNPENSLSNLSSILSGLEIDDFQLLDYHPQPSIKAELSTGLKK